MRKALGYAWIHDQKGRMVPPPPCPAFASSSVNRRIESGGQLLFPSTVAHEDTLAGHVEFALRHEGFQPELLAVAMEAIDPAEIVRRLRAAPNGEYIRKMAYLWEWFQGRELDAGVAPSAAYVPLLEARRYLVVENPTRAPHYRILENQLGNRNFCPAVERNPGTDKGSGLLTELVAELAAALSDSAQTGDLYERALSYIYLSETRSSFRIEREEPGAGKEEAFVSLLGKVGAQLELTEDWLVELQHLAVRNDFSREFSFRGKQNWLERGGHRVDYFPPAPQDLRRVMQGLLAFANDRERKIDPIAKAAIVSFGFVYAHPFMDGNGRLHRFLLHHALAQSEVVPEGLVMPVSAVLSKHLDRYFAILTSFSKPVTALWSYTRGAEEPLVTNHPDHKPYAYWNATREVELTQWALTQAVRVEVPNEVRFLRIFDTASKLVDQAMDLPATDIRKLVRWTIDQGGKLSNHRRKQYAHLPAEVLDKIEAIVGSVIRGEE